MGKCHRLLLHPFMWFLLLCLPVSAFSVDAVTSDMVLTSEEKSWLAAHKKIVVGGETDWAPFDFVDESGQYSGIANDYLKVIGEKLGIEVEIITGPTWNELLSMIRQKEIDVLPAIYHAKDREAFLLFTDPYFNLTEFVFSRSDDETVSSFADLKDKTIVVVKGYTIEGELRSNYPEYDLITAPTIEDALKKLITGEADAFIGDIISTSYQIHELSLVGIKPIAPVPFPGPKVHMAVRKDWPVLRNLIDKVLKAIPRSEHNAIKSRWMSLTEKKMEKKRHEVILTHEERAWLAEHPDITLGFPEQYEPYTISHQDGSKTGILVDILAKLNQRLGTEIRLTTGLLPKILAQVKEGELDGILALNPVYSAKLGFLQTQGYIKAYPTLFGNRALVLISPADLEGKKIVHRKGEYYSRKIIDQYGKGAQILEVDNLLDGLQMVDRGEADVFVGVSANSYIISKYQLSTIPKFVFLDYPDDFGISVRSDWPQLVSILNKGLASFSDNEMLAIVTNWIQIPQLSTQIPLVELSSEEKAWLKAHPVISVSNERNWPPFNFNIDGKPTGLSIDYMNLLADRIGIKVKYTSGEWGELLDQAFHKKLDVMLNIVKTPERQKHLLYTDSYARNPNVIITSKGSSISNTQLLFGKKVAYTEGFFYDDVLKTAFPEIIRVPMKNTLETLKAIQFGKVDAALGELAVVNYLIRENFLTGLAIKGIFESGNPEIEKLNIAVRNDWPILATILDKALLSITPDERKRLTERWISSGTDSRRVVSLADEEKDWLAQHPVIRVHNETASPPFSFSEHGRPKGFSIDYMRLLAEKLGFGIEFVTGPSWDEFLDMMKSGELDVMTNIAKTPERQGYLAFTPPYVTLTQTLYTRKDFPLVTSIEDLYGKRIAVPKGFYIAELLKKYPQVEVVEVRDVVEAIHAVSVGKADALYDIMPAINYLMNKHQITNLKVGGDLGIEAGRPMPLHLAVPQKDTVFAGILSKGMASITDEEFQVLGDKWLGSAETARTSEAPDKVSLTNAEKQWLEKHKVLRLGSDPEWPPFDFVDASGKQRGFAADLLDLLSKRLGISFDPVPDLTWPKILEAARERRLDVISILAETPERRKYLKFSTPLLSNPWVIVTKKGFRSVKNLGDMTQEKIAMAKGYSIVELAREAFPDLPITLVKSPIAGLEAVMSSQVDAYAGSLGVVSYLIQQNGLTNLKINATAGIKSQPFYIGVRSDWPELVSILNKGLASIPREEFNALNKRWIPVKMSTPKSEADFPISFRRLAAYVVAAFAAILLLAWVFLKLGKKERMLAGFGSRRFRNIVIAALSFFVIVVSLLGWFALTRIKSAILQDVEEILKTVLLVSEERLDSWEADRKAFMKQLGRDPQLVHLVEDLLHVPANPEALLSSKFLQEVRHYFKSNKDIFSNIGFFIISPQGISIGSMRNANVGTQNLIARKYPKYIKKAFDGQVSFVPPMDSDVQLEKASGSKEERKPPTMFFIGPVQNAAGKVIAVMTLRVDPSKDFSRVLDMSLRGSQESYAFDYEGRLITNSKFDAQLRQTGLIGKEQTAALNIEIRDPGGNMLGGYRPTAQRDDLPLTRAAAGAIAFKAKMEEVGTTFGHSDIGVDIEGYRDYRGVHVFGAWVWDKNLELGITVEIDMGDALSNYYRIRFIILAVLGLTLILFVCSTLFVLAMGERTHRSLTKARDTLEDKVKERTAELAEKQDLLQTAEERSRLLLHSAGEGIFGVNNEGVCIFANPAALNLLGYSEEELIGKNIHATIHHSHEDGTLYPIQNCPMFKSFTEGTAHRVADEVLWRKDGTHFPVEYASTPMEKEGSLMGAVITFADITERKAAEERFSALLESAPDAMIVTDETGNIVLVNSETEAVFGYSREELIGKKIEMLVPEEIRDVHPDYRAKFYADRKRFSMGFRSDFYGVARDGRKMPMDIGLSPIETAEGLLVVASVRDITERRRMEKALSEEHDRLQRILDTCPVAVAISVDGVIEYSNEFLTEFFGLKKEDMQVDVYVNPEDRDYVIRELERTGMVRNYELKAYDSKREICEVLSYYFKIEYNGKPAILSWWVDITEMKKTTKELEIKFDELTRFRRLAVGREHMMIELKKEINQLLTESGRPEEYKIH